MLIGYSISHGTGKSEGTILLLYVHQSDCLGIVPNFSFQVNDILALGTIPQINYVPRRHKHDSSLNFVVPSLALAYSFQSCICIIYQLTKR